MLEKKEIVLQKKVAAEVEKAKDFTREKNKRGMPIFFIGKMGTLVIIHGCLFM